MDNLKISQEEFKQALQIVGTYFEERHDAGMDLAGILKELKDECKIPLDLRGLRDLVFIFYPSYKRDTPIEED